MVLFEICNRLYHMVSSGTHRADCVWDEHLIARSIPIHRIMFCSTAYPMEHCGLNHPFVQCFRHVLEVHLYT